MGCKTVPTLLESQWCWLNIEYMLSGIHSDSVQLSMGMCIKMLPV